jgi:hypothetical protein
VGRPLGRLGRGGIAKTELNLSECHSETFCRHIWRQTLSRIGLLGELGDVGEMGDQAGEHAHSDHADGTQAEAECE